MRPENEPNLMRLYLWHCAIGFVLSAVFVGLILWQNVAGLGALVAGSDVGFLAVFLLWFFNGTIFGSAQFAIKLMLDADDDQSDDDIGGGQLIPAHVTERRQKRRKSPN